MKRRANHFDFCIRISLVVAWLALGACGGAFLSSGSREVMLANMDGHVVLKSTQMPIYYFLADRPGLSECVGSCLRFFKPVEVPTELSEKMDSFLRPDGIKQLQLLGRPLYTSVIDSAGSPPKAHRIYDGWAFLSHL